MPYFEFRTFLGLKVTANAAGPAPPDFLRVCPPSSVMEIRNEHNEQLPVLENSAPRQRA